MSTERARRNAVEELTLQNLTDAEAIRLLELANEGAYGLTICLDNGTEFSSRWNNESEGNARE